jgi:hypothetical protein
MDMQHVLSQLTDPIDDNDKKVHDDFMGMYMVNDMSRKQVEFKHDKDLAGRVYQLWMSSAISLLKANAHLRNYEKVLNIKRTEFEAEVKEEANDRQHFYWDLSVEIEGELTQLKAALDTFALLIGLVLGVKSIRTWSKKRPKKEEREYSGQNILDALTGTLPEDELSKVENLLGVIDSNKENLTKIVNVRDKFIHPNQSFMDFTSGFYFDSSTGEVIEPTIRYADGIMLQSVFGDQAFNFVFELLVETGYALLNSIGMGMFMAKDEKGLYQWYINLENVKDETSSVSNVR